MSDLLLRLSYLTLTNVFAFVRLLPIGDPDKDVEILADFFETRTLTGARLYVFAVIEQATATWTTSSLRTRAPAATAPMASSSLPVRRACGPGTRPVACLMRPRFVPDRHAAPVKGQDQYTRAAPIPVEQAGQHPAGVPTVLE